MGQPSKAGAVLLFLFGLPFLVVGLLFAFAFLSSSPLIHGNGNPLVGVIFGLAFAAIGAGLMVGAVYGYHKQKQLAEVQNANPYSPWLWKRDWATGKALSQTRNSVFGWWIGTGLASALVVPIAATTVPSLLRNSDPKALILIGVCLVPLILLTGAARATMRRERYGQTYFEFSSLPFSPGKHFAGQIHLQLNSSVPHGIDLRLACVRTITTGSGKEQTTNKIVLWEDQANVPQGGISVGPLGAAIPVDFGIPQDAYETNHDQSRDQLSWVLHAKADVPGVNYSDSFEVPVFRSGAAVDAFAPSTNFASDLSASSFVSSGSFGSSGSAAAATAPAFQSDATEVAAPAHPRVIVSTTPDGSTEFYFPAFRNHSQTLVLLLFTAVWTAVVCFLAHSRAPWFFALVFGFFDLLLIYGLFQSLFGSTQVIVGNGKLTSVRRTFGVGNRREAAFGDIQSVLASMGLQSSSGTNGSYRIRLQMKNGVGFSLADNITDRQEARWIVGQIEKLVGLKTDTHVALQDGFGQVYAPPVRHAAPGAVQIPAARRVNSVAQVFGLIFFLAWVGFIVLNIARVGKSSPRRGVPSDNSQRHVHYTSLTDADVQRIEQLPMQAQAEELLERAIQHDRRALELFEQKINSPEWIGRIKLTDRMKALERRSEFSSDLRVRYANADLNLSMDGWAKTDEAADLLIQRGQTDDQYRPAAVYFMGMMAGRGVAYERIYPVLLNYAKSDPNESVRQWAVEGMRYLGTDEALDQLFDSFVNDPSMQVRNRAGCNVSDCGNFKRAQRMRMVPNFLDLAANPSTSPQMRNWSFLALHEITGENLPNNVSAWRGWYDQHGTEKLSQFEQADWWQVNGDE